MPLSRSDAASPLRCAQSAFLLDLISLGAAPRERRATYRRPPRGTVDDRWHIYAHGYVARIAEALAHELPAVRRILGQGPFDSLVSRYLAKCPPRSYDLAHAGDRLADFLRSDTLSEELPFLPDLARLERRVSEAFVAADATPLAWAQLQGVAPEVVASLPLACLPGTACVSSRWPLLTLWRARDLPDDEVSIDLSGTPSAVVVHRRGDRVVCDALEEAEARVLAAALLGEATLEQLVARAEIPVPEALHAFKSLVERGIFQDTRNPAAETGNI